jgi:hypothetical protein
LLTSSTIEARRIDVAQIVARLIGTILGELHGEPFAGRSVETGHETINDPASDDLDSTKRREARRVKEVGAEGARALH